MNDLIKGTTKPINYTQEIERIEAKTYTQHNNMLEASYSLTLNEKRLIMMVATRINPKKQTEWAFKVTAREYAEAFDIKINNAARDLKEAVKNLYGRSIRFITPVHNLTKKQLEEGIISIEDEFRWLDRKKTITYGGDNVDSTSVVLYFPPHIREFFANFPQLLSNGYTSTQFLQAKRLKSIYSIRLYEWLTRFKDSGYFVITPMDLKVRLGIDDKYRQYTHLKQRVILPALKEINNQTNIKVKAVEHRGASSKTVKHLKFVFEVDNQVSLDFGEQQDLWNNNMKNNFKPRDCNQNVGKKQGNRSTRNIPIEEQLNDISWATKDI